MFFLIEKKGINKKGLNKNCLLVYHLYKGSRDKAIIFLLSQMKLKM